jgi:hypothetical protein
MCGFEPIQCWLGARCNHCAAKDAPASLGKAIEPVILSIFERNPFRLVRALK